MIYLKQNADDYNNDFRAMIQAFIPREKIVLTEEGTRLTFQAELEEERVVLSLWEDGKRLEEETALCRYPDKKTARNPIKAAAYSILSRYCNKTLPWGSMTGVRPTKFATARLEQGWKEVDIIREYEEQYRTTRQKGEICCRVAKREQELLRPFRFTEEYCLYIGIPFCLSRCLYCSFTAYPIEKYKEQVEGYLQALFHELEYVAEAYRNKRLVSVYMGGGTPTSLSAEQLGRVIDKVKAVFDIRFLCEFTVEAGRPDSLSPEKFAAMKERGITRISINPQTMNDDTLALIGRAHTAQMTVDAFETARYDFGFDNINMDMIAGLPGEDIRYVQYTLDIIRELQPDSLTVHSLAIKRAAELNIRMQQYQDSIQGSTNEMLMLADAYARDLGMEPYYLYRQKNIPGNLENVGYARPGKECLYNVLIMEEKMDIIAVGAGTATKLTFPAENRIERVENVKNVEEYMLRVDEMIARKQAGFSEKSLG
ncbi:MAG: coproporphyrinogen dehydrogenase HemZ [Bacteroides sp.]|nr:coproporphyrinogen dehydrogenase HemZ [Bacteroides sp.]MCM1548994.1 coproporphyrinogen dehydrogenase HemZ [Clostridium sp.]